MKNTKTSAKQSIRSRLTKNKKPIFMVIGALFVLTGILGFYNNFFMRFWSDFFLSLLLLILWLGFFPFTYSLQESLFGESLFSASLFTSTMVLVFVFSSFSLLMSVFQRDFIINVWSVIYSLIVLLRRSSVLPITAAKRKIYVWKNLILRRNGIFISFLVFSITIFTYDMVRYANWSLDLWYKTENYISVDEQATSNHCYASKQKLDNDDRIDVYISRPNNWWKVDQSSFSIYDIQQLEYYILWQSTNKQYYFNREICDISHDKPVLSIMYDGGMPVDEIYPGAIGGSVGNTSSFDNLDFEMWDYAINVFVSDNDSDRYFAKTLSFVVGQ